MLWGRLSDKERGGGDGVGRASRFGAAVAATGACRSPPHLIPPGLCLCGWAVAGESVSEWQR